MSENHWHREPRMEKSFRLWGIWIFDSWFTTRHTKNLFLVKRCLLHISMFLLIPFMFVVLPQEWNTLLVVLSLFQVSVLLFFVVVPSLIVCFLFMMEMQITSWGLRRWSSYSLEDGRSLERLPDSNKWVLFFSSPLLPYVLCIEWSPLKNIILAKV